MSDDPYRQPPPPPPPPSKTDDLQFDRAETAPPPPLWGTGEPVPPGATPLPGITTCAACGEPIADVYFEGNGKVVCPRCRDAVLASQTTSAGPVGFIKGLVLGVFAGAVGAAVWYGVRVMFNTEWSIIAIGIALLVGGAIRYGSGGRGGVVYQILAVVLTYLSICANYVPDIYRAMTTSEQAGDLPAPVLLLSAFVFSLKVPFLLGIENFMGWIIIAIGLWVAWRSNQPNRLNFTGPYRLAPASA